MKDRERFEALVALDEAERPLRRYWNRTSRSYDTNLWRGRKIGRRTKLDDGREGVLVRLYDAFGVGVIARVALSDGTEISRLASTVRSL